MAEHWQGDAGQAYAGAELGFARPARGNPDNVDRETFLKTALGASAAVQLTKFELPLEKVEEVRRGTTTLADAVSRHVKAKWSNAALQNPRKISEALELLSEEDIWAKGRSPAQ
jgi:hypothetical protein